MVYDAKKTYAEAHRLNINIQNIAFDVMLASYILDPSRSIDDVYSVVQHYGQNYVAEAVNIYGKGRKRLIPDDEVMNPYIAAILDAISASTPLMYDQLEEYNQLELFKSLELPLARILGEMEELGIYTDVDELQEMEKKFKESWIPLLNAFMRQLGKILISIHQNNWELYYLKNLNYR